MTEFFGGGVLTWTGQIAEWVLIATVFSGDLPVVAAAHQFLIVGVHSRKHHYHRTSPYEPRVAILVPAWNEGAVLGASIDRLVGLEYPADKLRVCVVDDASTDDTPDVVLAKGDESSPARPTGRNSTRG